MSSSSSARLMAWAANWRDRAIRACASARAPSRSASACASAAIAALRSASACAAAAISAFPCAMRLWFAATRTPTSATSSAAVSPTAIQAQTLSGPVRHLGLLLFGSGECLGLFKFRPLSRLQLSLALVTCVDAGVDKTTLCLAQFDAFSAGKLLRFRQQRPAQQRTVVVGTHFPLTYKWSQSVLEDAQGLVLFQPSVQPFPVLDQSLVRQRRLLMTKRGAVGHHQPGIGKLLHQQPTRFLQFLLCRPSVAYRRRRLLAVPDASRSGGPLPVRRC